ncbi:MAG: cell wall-binding repeat-containing protein [Clostridioides sp.]|jgi:uncharacterized repeat protein (TIGR02543 family)|nr:cell wall-binding repeat-containing protein [Clostridioides sp.]
MKMVVKIKEESIINESNDMNETSIMKKLSCSENKSNNAKRFIKAMLQVSVFILFFTFVSLKSNATSIESQGDLNASCKWILYDDGTLTIDKKEENLQCELSAGKLYSSSWNINKIKKIVFLCKVKANENSNRLFSYFVNLQKIENLNLLDTSSVKDMGNMFQECRNLIELNISKFNTSKVTNMSQMFYDCAKVTKLDVSKFNTEKVTTMESMFYCCKELTKLDVSKFNTEKVTTMAGMFCCCYVLETIDVSNFNTSGVQNMESMFGGCIKLQELDVSNFNTSEVYNMTTMFSACSNMQELDISNFDTRKVTSGSNMFYLDKFKSITLGENTFKSFTDVQATSVNLNAFDSNYYTGWVDKANQDGESYPTGKELFMAHGSNPAKRTYIWLGKPANIIFDLNYDTNGETSESYDESINTRYDQIINLSNVKPPQREGYVFKGWAESEILANSKTKTKINGTNVKWVGNKTLYAIWSKKSSSDLEQTSQKTVILANGTAYPDTLTASVLANIKNAPILLSNFKNVNTTTLNEIKRLGATEVIIIGGNQVVYESVVTQLEKEVAEVNVSRIWGEDRYQTAIKVGEEVRKLNSDSVSAKGNTSQNSIILAVGTNFPDAMSVTSLAEYTNTPILLTQTDSLNTDTQNALKSWNITNVTIIGKENAVSKKVEDIIKSLDISEDAENIISEIENRTSDRHTINKEILSVSEDVQNSLVLVRSESELSNVTASVSTKNLLNSKYTHSSSDIVTRVNAKTLSAKVESTSANSITVDRIGGEDRYETAKLIGEKLISLLGNAETSTSINSSNTIAQAILVDGTNFPDALTVSSLAGYYQAHVLLTQREFLNNTTQKALKDWSVSKITIAGGTNAVAKEIEDELKELKQNISTPMTIERLAGVDRYETAVKISQKYSSVK